MLEERKKEVATDLISSWRRCSFSVASWTLWVKSVCDCVLLCSWLVMVYPLGWAGREAHGDDGVVALAKSLESTGTGSSGHPLWRMRKRVRSCVARTCLCTVGRAVAAVVEQVWAIERKDTSFQSTAIARTCPLLHARWCLRTRTRSSVLMGTS